MALILRTKRPHLIGGVGRQAAIGDQLSIQPHPWLSMAINMVISQSRNDIVITISMINFFIIIIS